MFEIDWLNIVMTSLLLCLGAVVFVVVIAIVVDLQEKYETKNKNQG